MVSTILELVGLAAVCVALVVLFGVFALLGCGVGLVALGVALGDR